MRKRSEISGKAGERIDRPVQETPKTSVGMVRCQCGLEQPGGTSDCIACGARLPEFKLNAGEPKKHVVPEQENLGKLAYDLKRKDIDITLAQISAIAPDDRRELQKWVDAKTNDVVPRVRMILERLNELKVKPLAGPEAREDVFNTDTQPNVGQSHEVTKRHDEIMQKLQTQSTQHPDANDADVGEEVTYTLGKEMYRVAEFCTYDVGPYTATTRIRKGETRLQALARIRSDLEAMAIVDRHSRRDSTINTLLGIKPALTKAAESRKE